MTARNRPNQNQQQDQNQSKTINGADKSTYKCTHCSLTGHTKSQCFELVGYPDWWDKRDQRKRNSKATSTAAIVETNIQDDAAENASVLVVDENNGGLWNETSEARQHPH